MVARQHRLAIHAATAVLLAGVAVVATGAGAGAASSAASRPESYGGDATSGSMQFRVGRSPLPIPAVTDPFHLWVPYAETSLDSSGGSEGIASTVYPGQDAIGGPNLLCNFEPPFCAAMPGGAPPNYPDWAHAQYPAHPDDAADISQKPFPGSGPFEVTPNQAVAHADRDKVDAIAVTTGAGLAGAVTADSVTSTSHQSFEGSALVLRAESTIKGVDIGGQLHIDQIQSVATGKIDGDKIGTSTAVTTISGATVAGQAVTIDSTGIHVGPQGDNGLLKKTVNSALAKLADQGIDVRSLGATKSAKPSKVVAETGGLLVIVTHTVKGPSLPQVGAAENGDYIVMASLGGAGINAYAAPGIDFGGVQIPNTPVTGGTVPPPPGAGGSAVAPSTTQTGTTETGQQPALADAGSGTPKPAALPIDLTNKRLKTLALVLLAYPLLILATAPFRAPARLPRGR
jgi:hypothetical protein